jgi:DedD protein
VSDISRSAEEGFHEIQLSGKQLVFLFMATTVVAVVIFLCGVLVGRGVRAERAAASEASAADTVGVPPAPADSAAPAGASAEDLSYHRRLQGDAASGAGSVADDRLKPRDTDPPTPAETAPPALPATSQNRGDGERAAQNETGWVVQIAALRDRSAADAVIRRLAGKGYPAFLVPPAADAPAPGYRVRVGRFADRREAERVARRLEREEQFRPFITR